MNGGFTTLLQWASGICAALLGGMAVAVASLWRALVREREEHLRDVKEMAGRAHEAMELNRDAMRALADSIRGRR